jgi:hypothetical protein
LAFEQTKPILLLEQQHKYDSEQRRTDEADRLNYRPVSEILVSSLQGNALLRHAGLNLAEASSSKWKGQMSISKRGRPRLRHALFMATMALIMNDVSFKRQHEVNVKTKSMKPMRSVMKLCGKLARLLVAMAQSGEAYEPDRALPMKQTA